MPLPHTLSPIPTFNALGVHMHALNAKVAVEALLEAVRERRKGYVCISGIPSIMEAQASPAFRQILNSSFLNLPNSLPLVWLARYSCRRQVAFPISRVDSRGLMLHLFDATQGTPFTHFFYGGPPGAAEKLKTQILEKFPKSRIVGTWHPPSLLLTPQEERELVEKVSLLRPTFFWVGLSTPKQELFMSNYSPRLNTLLMLGTGTAFETPSGPLMNSSREPESARFWKRPLNPMPRFIFNILLQLWGKR